MTLNLARMIERSLPRTPSAVAAASWRARTGLPEAMSRRAATRTGRRRIAPFVTAVAVAWSAACLGHAPPADAQSNFPERNGFVANNSGMALSEARLNAEFDDRIAGPYALTGIAIVVEACAPDPEVYLDGALAHYGMAAADGQIANDAVAWLVCLEPRYVGFFWAEENPYANRLSDEPVTAAMVSQLQSGNFTGAFVDGIDEVTRQLAAAPSSGTPSRPGSTPASGQAGAGSAATAPAAAPGVVASGGEGGTSGGRGSGTLLTLLGLTAVAAGVYLLRRRSPAPPLADDPWQSLADRIEGAEKKLGGDSSAFARLVLAYQSLGDEAVVQLHERRTAMTGRLEQARARLEAARPTGGSALDDRQTAQVQPAEQEAIAKEVAAVEAYIAEMEQQADHAEMLVSRAPVLLVGARDALEKAPTALAAAVERFGLPPADQLLGFAAQTADRAEGMLSDGDRLTAGRLAEEASLIVQRLEALAENMVQADRRREETAREFERLATFAPTSWADVKGNGSEAEESLDAVEAMLQRLVDAEPAQLGKDPVSGYFASLEAIDGEVHRADSLLAAVQARLQAIEAARGQVQDRVGQLETEVAAARQKIEVPEVDRDVDSVPPRMLDEALGRIEAVTSAMAQPEPDWPALLRELEAADRAVDQALESARTQHERIQALERQAATAQAAAQESVSRGEKFLAAHRADIGDDAMAGLDRARAAQGKGRAAEGEAQDAEDAMRQKAFERAIAAYNEAATTAEGAFEAMRAEFSRAEEKRRPYVARRDWMGPVIPIPVNSRPFPFPIGGGFGSFGGRPSRPSRWGSSGGSRWSGGSSGSSGRSRPSSGGGSSSRRGGGRGW